MRCVDGRETGVALGAAGGVLLFAVLTSMPRDDDQQAQIRECRRILCPGGLLYVSDLLLNDDARNIERYDRFEAKYGVRGVFELPDGGVMRHQQESWLRSLLADFQLVHCEHLVVETMNGSTSRALQAIGRSPH